MIYKVNEIHQGDCLEILKNMDSESVNCCVTSPPYFGLRDYGNPGQIGLEKTPEEYVENMVSVFTEVKRVLKRDGTLWLNLGDSYGEVKSKNIKPKDLIGIPWMVAFALRENGWYLRQDIIWHKPNPMPESVTDRCTKAHEYIFLLSKSAKYYYDAEAIEEIATGFDGRKDTLMKGSMKYNDGLYLANGNANSLSIKGRERRRYKNLADKGQQPHSMHEKRVDGVDDVSPIRNKRSVWTVTTMPYSEAHFATFPERLIVDCIKAGCPDDGIVLDPFIGAGTTGLVARKLNRNFIGIELNSEYIKIANNRLKKELGIFL